MSERAGESTKANRQFWTSFLAERPSSWVAIVGVWISRPLNWLYVAVLSVLLFICAVPWSSQRTDDAFRNARSRRPSDVVATPSDLTKAWKDPGTVSGIDLSLALPSGLSASNLSRYGWSTEPFYSMDSMRWLKIDRSQMQFFPPALVDLLSGVTTLHVYGEQLDDDDIEWISQWSGVTHLELETETLPMNLAPLSAIPSLQTLVIRETLIGRWQTQQEDAGFPTAFFTQLRPLGSLSDLAVVAQTRLGEDDQVNVFMLQTQLHSDLSSELGNHGSLKRLWIGELRGRKSLELLDRLQKSIPTISLAHARFNIGTVHRTCFLCIFLGIATLLLVSNFTMQMTIPQARLVPGYHQSHLLVAILGVAFMVLLAGAISRMTSEISLPSAITLTSLVAFLAIAIDAFFNALRTPAVESRVGQLTNVASVFVFAIVVSAVRTDDLFTSHFLARVFEVLCNQNWSWPSLLILVAWASSTACLASFRNQTVAAHEHGLVNKTFVSPFSRDRSADSKQPDTPLQWNSSKDADHRLRLANRDNWRGKVRLVWVSENLSTPVALLRSSPWWLISLLAISWASSDHWQIFRYLGLLVGVFLAIEILVCLAAGNDQLKNEIVLPRSKSELFKEKLVAGAVSLSSTVGTAGLLMIMYQWFHSETFGFWAILLKLTVVVSCLVLLCALKMWFSTVNLWGAIPLILIGLVGVAVLGTILMMKPNGSISLPRSGLTEIAGSGWVAPGILVMSVAMIYGARGRWMSTEFTQL